MAKRKRLPLVAICGRPNVGKSTLFNRITGKQHAIVHAEEGITRDRTYSYAQWEGRRFRVVDTGGIVEQPLDPILKKMQEQVRVALKEATVIVFLVDGQEELTRIDRELAQELFKYGKPIFLAVNKLDNPKMEMNRFDFFSLGMGEPFALSATHNMGVGDMLDAIVAHFPPVAEIEQADMETAEAEQAGEEGTTEETAETPEAQGPKVVKVAVIGKPNVGKSSFINAILNEERLIVDNTPGTTRDAVDIEYRWKDRDYLLIDTAGLRKKAGIRKHVEFFSVARSLRAVRRADVCLVMMDATEGVTEQDKRILDYVQEQGTAMVIVWTKWDLIEHKDIRLKALNDELEFKAAFIKNVPVLTISNLTRQRLFKTFDVVDRIAEEAEKRIPTAELNRLMEDVRTSHTPPSYKGKYAKILYATQTGVKPTVFVLFVNQKRLFHFSYMRFIENKIREKYGFEGVPVRLELREEKPKK